MKCKDSKPLLERIADGAPELSNTAGLREHINGCEACSKYERYLAAYKRVMKTAPIRKSPDNLAGLVMKEISREPLSMRIIRLLFHPFKVKIPIETFGLAAAAAIIFFMYWPLTDGFKPQTKAPGEERELSYSVPKPPADSTADVKSRRALRVSKPGGVSARNRANVRERESVSEMHALNESQKIGKEASGDSVIAPIEIELAINLPVETDRPEESIKHNDETIAAMDAGKGDAGINRSKKSRREKSDSVGEYKAAAPKQLVLSGKEAYAERIKEIARSRGYSVISDKPSAKTVNFSIKIPGDQIESFINAVKAVNSDAKISPHMILDSKVKSIVKISFFIN